VTDHTIEIPEVELKDAPLVARSTLGADVREDERTAPRRVSFGRGEPVPLTGDGDAELQALLAGDPEHRYWVLSFTCSFRPGDEPIVESGLAVELRTDDGGQKPVIYALDPELLTRKTERTRTFSFSPKVLAGPATLGGEVSNTEKVDVEQAYVVGTGRREAIAEWFFRAQPAVALEGMHDLTLLVRVPAARSATAQISMTAKIRRRFAGLVPYRATLDPELREMAIPAS
jgi:hypothetical protein